MQKAAYKVQWTAVGRRNILPRLGRSPGFLIGKFTGTPYACKDKNKVGVIYAPWTDEVNLAYRAV